MDKFYNHKDKEGEIYQKWEEKGYFKPKIDPEKKPFTIVLPPPNASGKMHTGNVLMIAIEDLLIRWHRMKGDPTLWIPGTDHAGTETQITFERELKKQGKSRFSYSRDELYQAIWDFVEGNKGQIESQLRQMGASVDWSRYTFSLDEKVIQTVHRTFRKMVDDDLIYRGNYMVNYCPKCGTTYADVELKHEERKDPLYYMKYGPFVLATVRPETKFGDTAVAVNPSDKRYQEWIGKEIEFDGLSGKIKLQVIADNFVDVEFGTGVVKVTPAHDKNDYEAGLRHKLEVRPVIDLNGKLNEMAGRYAGLSVFEGRKQVVAALEEKGLIDHVDQDYIHTVALCKAGHEIEPMVLPNWFVKVDAPHKSFKKPALDAVKSGKVKIFPKWQEVTYIRWMEEMRDWPISRQNVWGIRIPVWYKVDSKSKIRVLFKFKNAIINGELEDLLDPATNSGTTRIILGEDDAHDLEARVFSLSEIKGGLQRVFPLVESEHIVSVECPGDEYLPETDTFDTWFSSGQWPLVALGFPDSQDFKYFYPTAVLETGWEIIRLWVSRMIMFGIYLTGEAPFKDVYLHGIVRALDGRKMSKSLGNVIDPEDYIKEYGVDALRMGLVSGTANGKDFTFPKDRVIAYKHFGNKIWNMGRFILMMQDQWGKEIPAFKDLKDSVLSNADQEIVKELQEVINKVDSELEKFRFADAAETIYQFMWHSLADKYIEKVKEREDKDVALSVLQYAFITSLKLLHPFMPFVTEEIYQKMHGAGESIMIESWPTT